MVGGGGVETGAAQFLELGALPKGGVGGGGAVAAAASVHRRAAAATDCGPAR
jgi:hypothetical protein